MQEGPFLFRDCPLMIEEFDRSTTTPSVMQTETILKQLASRVGEVERVEMKAASFGRREFHKARVKLAAEKPMHMIVSFSKEGSESMRLLAKYERYQNSITSVVICVMSMKSVGLENMRRKNCSSSGGCLHQRWLGTQALRG
jgi:hypothetical protein